LVDTGDYALYDLNTYKDLLSILSKEGALIKHTEFPETCEELLEKHNGIYLTSGLMSLKQIPDHSVDLIWSQAVLEHIKKNEVVDFFKELRRIISPGGICSHRVDLKDHLSGSLNSLRFSESVWESHLMATSGFYTNRLRYSEMMELFQYTGFKANVVGVDRWKEVPIQRNKLNKHFQTMSDDDLLISGFDVLLTI